MTFFYFANRAWLRLVMRCYFRWRVYHAERLPADGGVILASNHASYLDPPLIGCAAERELCYLARESIFRFPFAAAILRAVNVVPVDRDGGGGAGLKAILDRLLDGRAILLFPEGTRTRDGALQPARSGIGLVVIKSGAPVVPVRVFGSFQAYHRHTSLPRPQQVTVKFGQPMDFAALRAEAKTAAKPRMKQIYQRVADDIMAEIGKLEPHADREVFP